MKIIDDVFPAYINAAIGPCSNLRRFVAEKDYFSQRGYVFTWFSRDFMLNDKRINETIDFSKGLGFRSSLKRFFKKSSILSVLFQIREAREAEKLMRLYINQGRKADIVVVHDIHSAYYYLKHNKDNNTKVVYFNESDGLGLNMLFQSYPKMKNTLYGKWLEKKMLYVNNHIDKLVFISHKSKSNFIGQNPTYEISKVTSFHNGIENRSILRKNDEPKYKFNLCTTGTVCARKGQYLIIEALEKLCNNDRKDIHVSIIGDGNDLDNLKSKVAILGIEDHVSFLGFIPNSEVHSYLCGCDIYILMSNSEGLPISIIEAMRAGLGVISTPVAGIPEMVDETNGVLINPNSDELASVFRHLGDYDWKWMGGNSRARFEEEYTFSKMIESYCNVMDELTK